MKKIFSLAALSGLALMSGVDGAAAQAMQSAAVGNPDSANVLIMEEGYEVVAPAADPANVPAAQSADWSQEGNVEVAPLPENGQVVPATTNNNVTDVNVDETISGVITPDSSSLEVNETVSN